MSEKFDKFAKALDDLIKEGHLLHDALWSVFLEKPLTEDIVKSMGSENALECIKTLFSFYQKYQGWYSEALSLIKKILPDHLDDFKSYYEYPRARKNITGENYMIKDFLQGLTFVQNGEINFGSGSAFMAFTQQLNIVNAARKNLNSALMSLTEILQADLFDSEIDSAKALAKSGHLRASGTICGVVIEKHLSHVCDSHAINIRKKKPTISDLNNTLKNKGIITTPKWRLIQHIADVRNICTHAGKEEPTKEGIESLLSETQKVLKTVF